MNTHPIGIFDSGVGGLSVLNEIVKQLPQEAIYYVADQAHVPYGSQSIHDVREFSEGITSFLLSKGVKLVVIACNTASAAALNYLRDKFPQIPFVGMEPAVKPAAEGTLSGVVGVLATPATFQGELYASVLERFANGVMVLQHTCPGLVSQIEKGEINTRETQIILENALHPMLHQGIDRVVLGCTHYPFIIPLIQEIVGPEVEVIDPAPAIARQVNRILERNNLLNLDGESGYVNFFSTGADSLLETFLYQLMDVNTNVQQLIWKNGELTEGK